MSILKQHKILIIVIVVAIILFVLYSMSDKSPDTTLIRTPASAVSTQDEQEILTLLRDVQSITLDGSIFKDPAFASLRDFSREIIIEPTGKENPFDAGAAMKAKVDETTTDTEFTQEASIPQESPTLPDAI